MIPIYPELHREVIDGEVTYWFEEALVFGEIVIPPRALIDGFSIPKKAQGLFRKDPYFLPAAYPHDIPYKKGWYDHLTRKEVDKLLLKWIKVYQLARSGELLKGVSGMCRSERAEAKARYRKQVLSDLTKRQSIYWAVRAFGWRYYKKEELKYAHEWDEKKTLAGA